MDGNRILFKGGVFLYLKHKPEILKANEFRKETIPLDSPLFRRRGYAPFR